VVFDEHTFPAKDKVPIQLPSKVNASGDQLFIHQVSFISPDSSQNLSTEPITSADAETPSPIHPASQPLNILENHFLSTYDLQDASAVQPQHTNQNSSPLSPNSQAASDLFVNQPQPITSPNSHSANQPNSSPPQTAPNVHPMTTRSWTGTLKPTRFPDFHLYHTIRHPLTSYHTIIQETEPTCFSKVICDPRWQQAMTEEYQALITNGTWTLCPPPPHQNIISNKWVYRIMQRLDSSVERFKARLVAKGYEQQCGINYSETFSLVINASTIRVILSLAIQFD
jgi:hypothetical protein